MLFVPLLVPGGSVLLELAMGRRHHASARLRSHALIAGVREDLHERSVGQELGQSQLSGLGDVGAAAGLNRFLVTVQRLSARRSAPA